MLSFCECCHDIVPYNIRYTERQSTIKGVQYTYLGKEAMCNHCGSVIGVNEVTNYNLIKLEEAVYRKGNV